MAKYYVVRTNGSTAQRTFWKVLSRGFDDKRRAEDFADFERTLKINKRREVFIISKEE